MLRCWACKHGIPDEAWHAVSDKRALPTYYQHPPFAPDAELFHCCGRQACKDKIEAHIDALRRPEPVAPTIKFKVLRAGRYCVCIMRQDFLGMYHPDTDQIAINVANADSIPELIDTIVHEDMHRAIHHCAKTTESQDHFIMRAIAFG